MQVSYTTDNSKGIVFIKEVQFIIMSKLKNFLNELDVRVPNTTFVKLTQGGKGKSFLSCKLTSLPQIEREILETTGLKSNEAEVDRLRQYFEIIKSNKDTPYRDWRIKRVEVDTPFYYLYYGAFSFFIFTESIGCEQANQLIKETVYRGGVNVKIASQKLKIKEQEEEGQEEAPRSDVEVISTERAVELIKNSGGKTFDVSFRKRTGERELRRMNARLGVKKGVKGVGRKFDPEEKGLISVFEMPKDQFRFISIESIRSLRIGKKKYIV